MASEGTTVSERSDRRFAARYLAVLSFLLAALVLTLLLKTWQIHQAREHVSEAREEAVHEAMTFIQRDFVAEQEALVRVARSIAREEEVTAALRAHSRGEIEGAELAANYLTGLEIHESVELYDVSPRIVAWNGYSMPLDDAPDRVNFLESSQIAVVSDGAWRTALVAWYPVYDGRRPVGAVRAMDWIEVRVPVRNEYLKPRSLADDWLQETGLAVRAAFDGSLTAPENLMLNVQPLQGIDGSIVGHVAVEPPADDQVLAQIASPYADVAAFWAVLIGFWILAGLWLLYRTARNPRQLVGSVIAVTIGWWALRALLLILDIPARWQPGNAPLAPLFDPTRVASTAGFGLLRSAGDVAITAVFATLFAVFLAHWVRLYVQTTRESRSAIWWTPSLPGLAAATALISVLLLACIGLLAGIVRRVVLDSTLDYFARSGILPGTADSLVAVVFGSLLVFALAFTIAGSAALGWWFRIAASYESRRFSPRTSALVVAGAFVAPIVVGFFASGLRDTVSWLPIVLFLMVGASAGFLFFLRHGEGYRLLTLRGVLMAIFLLAVLLYPMYYGAVDAKRRLQMQDAADSFDEGRDPRVLFGIDQVLSEVANHAMLIRTLEDPEARIDGAALDSVLTQLTEASILGSLGPYDVSVAIATPQGEVIGRTRMGDPVFSAHGCQLEETEFEVLRAMYRAAEQAGPLIDRLTGCLERDRMQDVGVAPVVQPAGEDTLGWAVARVEPQTVFQYSEMPFPRVLLPQGFFGNVHSSLSLAEFRDGMLVRSLGRNFGRYRLAESVRAEMATQPVLWVHEDVEERSYLTLYRRKEMPVVAETPGQGVRAGAPGVVAALDDVARLVVVLDVQHEGGVFREADLGTLLDGVEDALRGFVAPADLPEREVQRRVEVDVEGEFVEVRDVRNRLVQEEELGVFLLQPFANLRPERPGDGPRHVTPEAVDVLGPLVDRVEQVPADLEVAEVEVGDVLPVEVGARFAVLLPLVPVVVLGVGVAVGVLEVGVRPGGVVEHEVEQDVDVVVVGGLDERLELLFGAEVLGDGEEVDDVVAVVGVVVLQDGRQPDAVDAHLREVVQPLREGLEGVFGLVVVAGVAADVDLVQRDRLRPLRRVVQPDHRHLVAVAFDVHVTTDRGTTRLTVVVEAY